MFNISSVSLTALGLNIQKLVEYYVIKMILINIQSLNGLKPSLLVVEVMFYAPIWINLRYNSNTNIEFHPQARKISQSVSLN